MKRCLTVLLVSLMLVLPLVTMAAEVPPTHQALTEIEVMLYGGASEGPLVNRLSSIEQDLFGSVKTGAFVQRLASAYNYITGESLAEGSVILKLNVIEWALFQNLSTGSIVSRIGEIENQFYGQLSTGSIFTRVNTISSDIFPASSFNVESVKMPSGTMVKVKLDTDLNSEQTKAGTVVAYTVAEDVVVNERLVIPAGAQGRGTVLSVEPSGNMGKGGSIEISWGTLKAIDGTRVDVGMTEKTINAFNLGKNEISAASSVAGGVVISPVGLASGLFVKGKEMIVPGGTRFSIEVKYETRIGGVLFN
ncbi:MAG: hypothetical protein WCS44_00755 [Bacillota bacterium]